MQIAYVPLLERAYRRMVAVLFRPFDLAKWLVVGFGCWLAELTSGGPGGNFWWVFDDRDNAEAAVLGAAPSPFRFLEDLDWPAVAVPLIGCAVVFLVGLIVVLHWLSSRGRFIFLDNLLADRAAVKEPWKEYRREGDSLFLWRLGLLAAVFVAVLLAAVPGILLLAPLVRTSSHEGVVGAILALVLPVLAVGVVWAYVKLFLTGFVVPLMLRHRLTATEGWRRFLPLLRRHLWAFLLYGLFVFGLSVAVFLGLLIAVLVTCCIAGILLALPYLGTVALLPVYVTFRFLSLEFLAQFGPDFDVLPPPVPQEPEPPPGADAPEQLPPLPELPPQEPR